MLFFNGRLKRQAKGFVAQMGMKAAGGSGFSS